jgi:hypothetical protein
MGDLFEPVLALKQTLPDLKKLAAAAVEEAEPIEIAAQAEDARGVPARRAAKKVATKPAAGKTRRKV